MRTWSFGPPETTGVWRPMSKCNLHLLRVILIPASFSLDPEPVSLVVKSPIRFCDCVE